MTRQTPIPFLFMRGGTSRGPYFLRSDLPSDLDKLSEVLIGVVGAGHEINIDGIGGGVAVTTKVAMVSRSEVPGVDIDYFFAQVGVTERLVDYKPTCGNMLAGVGPAALEMGLLPIRGDETRVVIRSVNTGATVEAVIQTPDGAVNYAGSAAIAGVPGTAAPIALNFMDVVGSSCGSLFPTGRCVDRIDGVDVTCMDVAMPVVMARASDFGLTGRESVEQLDADTNFFKRIEAIRLQAGERMGMGDVRQSVVPKFAVLAPPSAPGSAITARYFMPWKTHPSMAVTGAQCIAACAVHPGTVADGLSVLGGEAPLNVVIEHPSGSIDVLMDFAVGADGGFSLKSAGLLRTARLLAKGDLMVPAGLI
ncbi:MAG: 4-oxalomesaconate tautomerase [Rubrivivax sp.]